MICQDCKNGYHESCRGSTWCPCQHRRPTLVLADMDKVIVEVPPEVADAIEWILAHPELLVRRERPQRKPLVELVAEGTYTTEAEVREAALVELTQLAQEMGLE